MNSIDVDGLVYGEHMIRELRIERGAAITRAEQAEAERDKWQAFEAANVKEYGLIERLVTNQIAAWLDTKAAHYVQNRNIGPYSAGLAHDIRVGAWREKAGE